MDQRSPPTEKQMTESEPAVSDAQDADAHTRSGTPGTATPVEAPPEFPGCHPIRLTRHGLEDFEGRIEYWEASSGTAWVISEPTTVTHERPTRRLGRLAELIAAVRGSPIESFGSMDLVLLDQHGEWLRLMQADETLYLHPRRVCLPDTRLMVGEHDFPDVVLEVDYSTDVRRGKLSMYQSWGFPEIWVEMPASYRARRRPGLTIHVREADGYRESPESRAFPGWTVTEIHTALSGESVSEETYRVLERVGRRLGAREGTGPDDSPLLRSLRGEARSAGLAEGRASALVQTVRSVLQVRGIALSTELAGDMARWSGLSHEALVSAAMSCEDEADFRARVLRGRTPSDDMRDPG